RESQFAFQAASARLVEAFLYASQPSWDVPTRAACLAHIAGALILLDPERQIEQKEGLHTLVRDALASDITHTLRSTADHYESTRHIVRALCKTLPEDAFALAARLNMQLRRDRARADAIMGYVQQPL